MQSVFKGKTHSQLQFIFQGIEGKIRAGGPNLDMGYWESLLQQLRAHTARARSAGLSLGLPGACCAGGGAPSPNWSRGPGAFLPQRAHLPSILSPYRPFVSSGVSRQRRKPPKAACAQPGRPSAGPTAIVYKFSACLAL